MTTNDIYELVTRAIQENITEPWTVAQLTVQYLTSSQDVEFEGTYLDASGEAQQLSTEFPDDVTEAVQALFANRSSEGQPRSNRLAITVSAQGRLAADYSWDQEIQDEDDHFSNGGTVKEWIRIREARYGSTPE
jgi:hypothetical protein